MLFRQRKLISIGLLILVIFLFGICFIIFYLTQSNFPDPGLRNQTFSKPHLTEIYRETIEKETESHSISFNNSNENIYTTLKCETSNEITIFGYCGNKEIENGKMNKNNEGLFEYKFCFDYFNINSLTIKFDNKCLINELVVYYIK